MSLNRLNDIGNVSLKILVGDVKSVILEKLPEGFIAHRKLQELGMFQPITREAAALREQLEKTAVALKQEWVEALAHVEKLKKQSKLLQRAEAGRQEILRELELAQQAVAKRKEAFYRAVEQLRNHAEVYA